MPVTESGFAAYRRIAPPILKVKALCNFLLPCTFYEKFRYT
jgi:hypothetical protein